MPTIAERRVTSVPAELQSPLRVEPCCIVCGSRTNESLGRCSSCDRVCYCSPECQRSDWSRHKKEDKCKEIKEKRRAVAESAARIRANHEFLMLHYDGGHPVPAGSDTFDRVTGYFYNDPLTEKYMEARHALGREEYSAAKRHQTAMLWEKNPESCVEEKRLAHMSLPDLMDANIPALLVKLHRDDDAVAYIRYWLEWCLRPINRVDPVVVYSREGEWPYPVEKDCRFLDLVDSFTHFNTMKRGDGVMVYNEFLSAYLIVKVRILTIHRSGKLHDEQWKQLCRLMDFIDRENSSILPALLNPDPLISQPEPTQSANGDPSDAYWFVKSLLEDYQAERGAFQTLKTILIERYGSEKPIYDYQIEE